MFTHSKPKKDSTDHSKSVKKSNTMFVTFQLNLDNPITINLDYHYMGETIRSNNVAQEYFSEEVDEIVNAIKAHKPNCCVAFWNLQKPIQEVNCALLQRMNDTENKILHQIGNDNVKASCAIEMVHELERYTKNILGMGNKHRAA